MSGHVDFANKRLRTYGAAEWFGGATRMDPFVHFQIPLGGERSVADRACKFHGTVRHWIRIVGHHMQFDAGLKEFLVAQFTLDHCRAAVRYEFVRMRNPDMPRKTIPMDKTFATVWTAFGLFLVRLSVPSDLRFGMEHFATPADEVLLSRTNIQMFSFAVKNQVGLTPETAHTDFALETSLGGVHTHMVD